MLLFGYLICLRNTKIESQNAFDQTLTLFFSWYFFVLLYFAKLFVVISERISFSIWFLLKFDISQFIDFIWFFLDRAQNLHWSKWFRWFKNWEQNFRLIFIFQIFFYSSWYFMIAPSLFEVENELCVLSHSVRQAYACKKISSLNVGCTKFCNRSNDAHVQCHRIWKNWLKVGMTTEQNVQVFLTYKHTHTCIQMERREKWNVAKPKNQRTSDGKEKNHSVKLMCRQTEIQMTP